MKNTGIISRLKKSESFAFSRWGDGEWAAVWGQIGRNVDRVEYKKTMVDGLGKIVNEKQSYFMGLQPLSVKLFGSKVTSVEQDWVNADELHDLSKSGGIGSFLDELKKKRVVYVGSQKAVAEKFGFDFISVHPTQAWEAREKILEECKNSDAQVMLFSCAMAANWLVHNLWNADSGKTYIDTGSLFEPFIGVNSRSYHKDVLYAEPIYVGLATYPGREKHAREAVESLLKCNTKPTKIFLCLNEYERVPRWAKQTNVVPFIPEEDEKARGKFYMADKVHGFFFTCDDDIKYPRNYIGYLRHQLIEYKLKYVVGIHGTSYKGPVNSYWYDPSGKFHFASPVKRNQFVTMLGTGTMAFHTLTLPNFGKGIFEQKNMLDPTLAVWMHRHEIQGVTLARSKNYLTQILGSQIDSSIWRGVMKDDTEQTEILNKIWKNGNK